MNAVDESADAVLLEVREAGLSTENEIDTRLVKDLEERLTGEAFVGAWRLEGDEAVLAIGEAFGEETSDGLDEAVLRQQGEGGRAVEGVQTQRPVGGGSIAPRRTGRNKEDGARTKEKPFEIRVDLFEEGEENGGFKRGEAGRWVATDQQRPRTGHGLTIFVNNTEVKSTGGLTQQTQAGRPREGGGPSAVTDPAQEGVSGIEDG